MNEICRTPQKTYYFRGTLILHGAHRPATNYATILYYVLPTDAKSALARACSLCATHLIVCYVFYRTILGLLAFTYLLTPGITGKGEVPNSPLKMPI